MTFIEIDPEEYPHPNKSDWFLVKWLRLRKIGFFDEFAGGDAYSKQGWVSKKWGLFMWKFVIPVLVKLHKMKWQAVYDADENDEIGWEYKYLRDCGDGNGWVVRKISDIDPEDFTYFKAQYTKEVDHVWRSPPVREITEDTITLESPASYACYSCGWEAWDQESFFKAWNCRIPYRWSGSTMGHMGTCNQWDEEWFCTRCWSIFSYSNGCC